LSAFSLSMADGATLNQDSLKGHWTLLFFGFTHCPDVCPNTLSVLKQTTQRLADDPLYRAHGQVVFVSVDPERDQPAALAKYVHYFNPQFLAATGPAAALADLTRPLGVIHARVPLAGEDYAIDHTASIFLIDPALRLLGVWSLPHEAETISTAFRQISAFGAQNP
jgi:protein SCO1/2